MNRLLDEFWQAAGHDDVPRVELVDAADVLPSPLPASELAVGAVASAATAAAALAGARGAGRPAARVDGRRVSAAFRSDRLLRIDGAPVDGFAPLSGFWRAADGWVRTHANYPHHRERLLVVLGLADSAGPGDLAAALRARAARDLEETVTAAGGICVAVRDHATWLAHPQAVAVAGLPLVRWSPLGAADPPRPAAVPTGPLLPAAGLRVLDLTRVLAGPVATRTLALLGADVLRVDPPRLPEISWQHLDTGMGKRSTLLDLDDAEDRRRFDALLDEADVVVTGYRPGGLRRHGLAPDQLAERRPALVIGTLSAWGGVGPWGSRRGFDSIVQAATGAAVAESRDGETPGALPAQALDHATGYLLAAGLLLALARRYDGGGGCHVEVSLARTAQWLFDHTGPAGGTDPLPDVDDLLVERPSASGRLRVPVPAVQIEGGPDDWPEIGRPWGGDPPQW